MTHFGNNPFTSQKILHVIYTEGISGAEKHIQHLLPGLKQYGFDCELLVVCSSASEAKLRVFANEIARENVGVTLMSSPYRFSFSLLKRIANHLAINKITVIHSHLVRTDLLVSLVKKFFMRNLFIISTKHGYNEGAMMKSLDRQLRIPKNLFYYLTLFTVKKSDRNIAVSKYISDLFFNAGLSNSHFPVVHHGVPIPKTDTLISDTTFMDNAMICIVGRLTPLKGHEYLLRAMPLILEKVPGCKLFIIGDGVSRAHLEALTCELNLNGQVEFTGFRTDAQRYVKAADVVVAPSLLEPFGLVFIEAMALARATVAFDAPAADEIFINNNTGILVPPRDYKTLAHAITKLLTSAPVRSSIATAAFESYNKNFTVEKMTEKTAALYTSFFNKTQLN